MTTKPVQTSPGPHQIQGKGYNLKTEDFIKMMVTQLQNQDPLDPTKNQDLMAQMSQIGQIQSASSMQDAMKGMMLQTQIGSAASLIGKSVRGLDANNATVSGLVNSVKVQSDGVSLELDNGKSLDLTRVTSIGPATPAATGAPAK